MEKSSLKFSGLSDEQIILVASQLSAAACASLPRLDDEKKVFERVQNIFEQCCLNLQTKREGAKVFLFADCDLS